MLDSHLTRARQRKKCRSTRGVHALIGYASGSLSSFSSAEISRAVGLTGRSTATPSAFSASTKMPSMLP